MNAPVAPAALAASYARIKEQLLSDHPELASDDQALIDTLDGQSDLADVVAMLVRKAREDDAHAKALKSIEADNEARRHRYERRAERKMDAALSLMEQVGRATVDAPDCTVSIRHNPPKAEVYDLDALPAAYVRITRTPDRNKLREAMAMDKAEIPGARLGNGSTSLRVLWR